mmetsp:Transcript_63531/g.104937  ORF Transcript_63531/g.104937 Transcript_63531/m.104937 type:complete len:269 (-) Transcript_63531:137-943(-)
MWYIPLRMTAENSGWHITPNDGFQILFDLHWDLVCWREKAHLQGIMMWGYKHISLQALDHLLDKHLYIVAILLQHCKHVVDGHCFFLYTPTVIICNHAAQGPGHFSLSCELCFSPCSHSDHLTTPLAIHVRLSTSAECRAFHADICALGMACHVWQGRLEGFTHKALHLIAHRISKHDMSHKAISKERCIAVLCAINELVHKDEVQGLHFLLQGATGRHAQQVFHTQFLQGPDVCFVWDFSWQMAMPNTMPCNKGTVQSFNFSQCDRT